MTEHCHLVDNPFSSSYLLAKYGQHVPVCKLEKLIKIYVFSQSALAQICHLLMKQNGLHFQEKNVRTELERQQISPLDNVDGAAMPVPNTNGPMVDPARLKEAIDADRFWEKYLAVNDTVIARSFQVCVGRRTGTESMKSVFM